MKKFFLFKRKDVSASSSSVSDNGEGLDILAVAADSLAFITASLGRVHIVFNDATIYEENSLLEGESLKKTSVSVACDEGKEASVIESIMKFVSSEKTTTNIMRFDAVDGKATIGAAKVNSFTDRENHAGDQQEDVYRGYVGHGPRHWHNNRRHRLR